MAAVRVARMALWRLVMGEEGQVRRGAVSGLLREACASLIVRAPIRYTRRGQAYAVQGRVLDARIDGHTISGEVKGSRSQPYEVTLDFGSSPDDPADCTCPVANSPCKHAVALAAAVLLVHGGDLPPFGPRQEKPAKNEPSDDGIPRTRATLDKWAVEHGVDDLLKWIPYNLHAISLSWEARQLQSLAEVMHPSDTRRRPKASDKRAIWSWLTQHVPLRQLAIAQEEELATQVPARSDAAAVWHRLKDLHTQLRRNTPPARLTHTMSLRVSPDDGSVTVSDIPVLCPLHRVSGDVVVLPGNENEPARVRSSCNVTGNRCIREALAVARVMQSLSDLDAYDGAGHTLLEELARPDWERTLQRLDQLILPEWEPWTDGGLPAQLAWRLDAAGLALPILVRPRKRGKGIVIRKTTLPHVRKHLRATPLGQRDEAWRRNRDIAALVEADLAVERYTYSTTGRQLRQQILERLAGHPLVFLTGGAPTPLAVRQSESPALVTVDVGGGEVELRVRMCGRDMTGPEAAKCLAVRIGDAALDIDASAGIAWLISDIDRATGVVRGVRGLSERIPAEGHQRLTKSLHRLAAAMPVELAPPLRGTHVPSDDTLVVRFELLRDASQLAVSIGFRVLDDLPVQAPGVGDEQCIALRADGTVHVVRDLARELSAADALAERFGLPHEADEGHIQADPDDAWCWYVDGLDEALQLVEVAQNVIDAADSADALDADEPQVVLEWAEERRLVISREANAADLQVSLRPAGAWFQVGGELQVDGLNVSLADLLAAVRDRRRFVRVADGQYVRLSDKLRILLADAATLSDVRGQSVSMSQFEAPALAALEDEGVALDAPAVWRDLLARMTDATEVDVSLPSDLNAELRDYQRRGYEWLARVSSWSPGACLADDMGLGKTVQALALLLRRSAGGPALVVGPTSLGFNWAREAERFAPGLRVVPFRGKAHAADFDANALGPNDVVVTSYDLLHIHADAFQARRWPTVVLDEAQAIKNPRTRRAKAVFALEIDFVLALTGTPVENRTAELWSLFRAVAPGLLGSAAGFRERFVGPIERRGDVERRALLARVIRPFILRRLKSEVARELPERTDVLLEVELSAGERRLYDQTRAAALLELAGGTPEANLDSGGNGQTQRFRILAALTRLRQLACHPRLVNPRSRASSAKLSALLGLLAELHSEGHRALIFSQFTSHLALVREALDDAGVSYRYLDGSTPAKKRRREVDAFQSGEGDCFLLSLKAGGTGLNLTAADYVVHLDPWWNPAVEDQATDRAHRIGQHRPVTVYRLVARDTVEEAILALHSQKRELVAGLLDGSGKAGALSTEDLMALIRESGREALDTAEAAP